MSSLKSVDMNIGKYFCAIIMFNPIVEPSQLLFWPLIVLRSTSLVIAPYIFRIISSALKIRRKEQYETSCSPWW